MVIKALSISIDAAVANVSVNSSAYEKRLKALEAATKAVKPEIAASDDINSIFSEGDLRDTTLRQLLIRLADIKKG